MHCLHIRERLDAWVDDEMPAREASEIERHLAQCPGCRREAEAIRRISALLDALPAVNAPPAMRRKTLRTFRTNVERAGIAEWWQGLNLAMRSAFCGAALAGLLCGAVLGTSVTTLGTNSRVNPYQTLCASTSKGFFP
jgi:anti-sigma factor RsiW